MKRIVVPTDFSDCALSALKIALKISEKTGSQVSLVHTYELPVYGFRSAQLMYDGKEIGKIKQQIEDGMQKIAKMPFVKKHKIERYVLPDYTVDQIADHKVLGKADMIVMGTHGTSGLKEEIVGSNTEKVIRRAKCPVLAVRSDTADKFKPKNLVFASTFYGEVYDRFPKISEFADLFGMKIHLLHVNTPANFVTTAYCESLMNAFVKKFKLTNITLNIYNDQSIEDGVLNFSKKIGADIIATETHGRTGINHLINGSVAEDIANHSEIPVLTFRIKEMPKPTGVIFPEI